MFKLMRFARMAVFVIAAPLLLSQQALSAQPVLGSDAASCRLGAAGSAILVNISGFKNRNGWLRVQLYGSNPADFLAKGKKLRRVELPVTNAGNMLVCIAVPGPGKYAIAVRHDADANGKSGWSDGGGFSRNPSISLIDLKPKHNEVVIAVGNGVMPINVVLMYRRGLAIGPIKSG